MAQAQRLAGAHPTTSHSLAPCASRQQRRPLRLNVAPVKAVLADPPSPRRGSSPPPRNDDAYARAKNAMYEVLLGPSLSEDLGLAGGAPVQAAPLEAGCVYHFVYGSSMAFNTLARQGVRPLARDAAMVVDPSIRMRFRHRGGYATLEPVGDAASPAASAGASPSASGSSTPSAAASYGAGAPRPRYPPFSPRVHGVLYKLAADDLARLAKKESGYVLRDVEVQTYDGRRAVAQAFVSGPLAQLPAEVAPTEKYMRALREGAADNYLDPLHQAWLSSVETVSSAGLGAEYFNTPSKWVAYGFMAVTALLVVGFFVQR